MVPNRLVDMDYCNTQKMMKTLRNSAFFALIVLLASCSGSQSMSSYDDIYYSPKDEVAASNETYVEVASNETYVEYVDIDDREEVSAVDDYPKGREIEEYYDPEQVNSGYDSSLDYDDYRERYNEDEYHYSSRFRRFQQPAYGFGYYDPFYSNSNWYSYDPYFWSPQVVRPYYYSPGWGFNWNSQFGWTASYSSGWYNPYGYGGFNGGYGAYGYNPYSYYGNSYCPQYGAGGYGNNDFYYNATPIYRGQYNSLGSYSSSSSTQLGKMLPPTKPMYDLPETSRPATNYQPASRPDQDYMRPTDSSRPATTRPAETRPADARPAQDRPSEMNRPVERPRDTTKPREDYRPRETQPSRPQTRPTQTPRQNRSVTPPSNNRGGGSASPSRSTSPSRSGGSGSKGRGN